MRHARHDRRYDRRFLLSSLARKKVPAAFDGGRITSDGVMLLSLAERRLGIAERLARHIPDARPTLGTVMHRAQLRRHDPPP